MSKITRGFAKAATASNLNMSYGATFAPKGCPHAKYRMESTATRNDRQKARTRSHVATSTFRAKLVCTDVVQSRDDSSWLHVVAGMVVARFATVGEAVAAL